MRLRDVEHPQIIELGAGQSGLAGFHIIQQYENSSVLITDGNSQCVNSKRHSLIR
jgi:cation diffusion facilitator CzcD-associated flavoprotein CzcO